MILRNPESLKLIHLNCFHLVFPISMAEPEPEDADGPEPEPEDAEESV